MHKCAGEAPGSATKCPGIVAGPGVSGVQGVTALRVALLQDGAAACGDDAAMATYSSSPMTEAPTMERDGFVLARLDEVVQAARTDSLWFMIFGLLSRPL